jgi:predicted N-acetyltransferase YhbS
MNIEIRRISEPDYPAVINITREAFWNLYVPGCDEHYLAHVMRNHPDYIAELSFAAVHENTIIGSIQYTRSHIINNAGVRIDTCTFGQVSVEPRYQRKGVGGALINHSAQAARVVGYKAVIILGSPFNYFKHGFRSSKDFAISDREGKFPFGLLALELEKGFLGNAAGNFHYSVVYDSINNKNVEEFDAQFDPKEKKHCYSQDMFALACRSYVG